MSVQRIRGHGGPDSCPGADGIDFPGELSQGIAESAEKGRAGGFGTVSGNILCRRECAVRHTNCGDRAAEPGSPQRAAHSVQKRQGGRHQRLHPQSHISDRAGRPRQCGGASAGQHFRKWEGLRYSKEGFCHV